MDKKEINEFFESVLNVNKVVCEECGCTIYSPTRANCAHILPKSIFKSVATNKDNFLWLCLQCHSNFDSSYSKAMKMKCWDKALEQYKKFKNEVIEYHKFLTYFENGKG